jgi:DNA-directed RNA polymerase specialized sigma24 family protein
VLQVPPRHALSTARRRRRHRAEPSADQGLLAYSIEAILRALPRPHREILAVTYFRRQTTRQVARQLNITDEDVRRRVYHATRDLAAAVAAARLSRPDELPPTNPDRWRRSALTR